MNKNTEHEMENTWLEMIISAFNCVPGVVKE